MKNITKTEIARIGKKFDERIDLSRNKTKVTSFDEDISLYADAMNSMLMKSKFYEVENLEDLRKNYRKLMKLRFTPWMYKKNMKQLKKENPELIEMIRQREKDGFNKLIRHGNYEISRSNLNYAVLNNVYLKDFKPTVYKSTYECWNFKVSETKGYESCEKDTSVIMITRLGQNDEDEKLQKQIEEVYKSNGSTPFNIRFQVLSDMYSKLSKTLNFIVPYHVEKQIRITSIGGFKQELSDVIVTPDGIQIDLPDLVLS